MNLITAEPARQKHPKQLYRQLLNYIEAALCPASLETHPLIHAANQFSQPSQQLSPIIVNSFERTQQAYVST